MFLSGGSLSRGDLCQGDPPVRLRAGGTHPIGMHSCETYLLRGQCLSDLLEKNKWRSFKKNGSLYLHCRKRHIFNKKS